MEYAFVDKQVKNVVVLIFTVRKEHVLCVYQITIVLFQILIALMVFVSNATLQINVKRIAILVR